MSGAVADQDEWIARVLGVVPPLGRIASAGGKTVSAKKPGKSAVGAAAAKPQAFGSPIGPALSRGRRAGVPIAPAIPAGAPATFGMPPGRQMEVRVGPDGRVAFKAPSPPVREVTFSGGGGKGVALPGAAAALETSGVLDEVRVIHGASVGSMTAALLSAGMSAETFADISNNTDLEAIVKGGDKLAINLEGDQLEAFVREKIGESVRGQIASFVRESGAAGDPDVTKEPFVTLQAIDTKISHGEGVTFGDLRTLSKIIPRIKEVVISGTMMGDDSARPGEIEKDGKPQLAIFSADTEPDLDVARAVHASAALPPVFKPVNIRLSSGVTAKFQDGGVMNNAPTSDLVGAERKVDPIPADGQMTFVFEGEDSKEILAGEATPNRSRINDLIAHAPNSAAEYAKNRGLADRPEDVVMVPLKIKGPWYKRTDFSGLIGGTVNFNIRKDARLKLQELTAQATQANIDKRRQPETTEFASVEQMLACIGRDDLAMMAQQGFPGAADALAFRDEAVAEVAALEALAVSAQGGAPDAGAAQAIFDKLNALAGTDVDRLGFVGRELNRSGKLDTLLQRAKASGAAGAAQPDVLTAGVAVADSLDAKSHAQNVLREVVYPKMIEMDTVIKLSNRTLGNDVEREVLRQLDNKLRAAVTPAQVNDAIDIAATHFAANSRVLRRPRDPKFAAALRQWKMPAGWAQ